MRTIKTYSKGAPLYNVSSYRHVGLAGFPDTDTAYRRLASYALESWRTNPFVSDCSEYCGERESSSIHSATTKHSAASGLDPDF